MRIIIAGSRDIDKRFALWEVVRTLTRLDYLSDVAELVTGDCPSGPDQVPYMLRDTILPGVPVVGFPARWDLHGKSAGPRRNREMAEYADAAIVVMWKGGSRGSQNMISEMRRLNKLVEVIEI